LSLSSGKAAAAAAARGVQSVGHTLSRHVLTYSIASCHMFLL